jgi:hypothetical protein
MSSIGSTSSGRIHSRPTDSRLGMFAVSLSFVCWACLLIVESIFFIALLINGDEGVSDNWVGYMTGYTLLGSLVITFITFLTAIVLRRRHYQHPRMWIALYGFPVLVLLTVLIELFVIE